MANHTLNDLYDALLAKRQADNELGTSWDANRADNKALLRTIVAFLDVRPHEWVVSVTRGPKHCSIPESVAVLQLEVRSNKLLFVMTRRTRKFSGPEYLLTVIDPRKEAQPHERELCQLASFTYTPTHDSATTNAGYVEGLREYGDKVFGVQPLETQIQAAAGEPAPKPEPFDPDKVIC